MILRQTCLLSPSLPIPAAVRALTAPAKGLRRSILEVGSGFGLQDPRQDPWQVLKVLHPSRSSPIPAAGREEGGRFGGGQRPGIL